MGKLAETLRTSGTVSWEVIKRNGSVVTSEGKENTIQSELKNKLSDTLYTATNNFGLLNSPFNNDDFSSPTNGESGIVLNGTSPTALYQMDTSLDSNSSLSFTIEGVIKASASYSIPSAILGHYWSTTTFLTDYSAHTFSSQIELDDGDQLNVTWQITISDS